MEKQLQESANPPQTAEELEVLRSKNPDMFAAFESMVGNTKGVTEARVKELETQLASTRQEKAVGEVVKSHGDFYDIVSSGEWNTWKQKQPSNIQLMIEGNTDDSASMIRAIDLYKFDTGAGNNSQSLQQNSGMANNYNSAADSVTTGQATSVDTAGTTGTRIWTDAEIGKMSLSEYENNYEAIQSAIAEGRVRDTKPKR